MKEVIFRCWVLKDENKDEFITRTRSLHEHEHETFPSDDISRSITFDTANRANDWAAFHKHNWSGFIPLEIEITKSYRKV